MPTRNLTLRRTEAIATERSTVVVVITLLVSLMMDQISSLSCVLKTRRIGYWCCKSENAGSQGSVRDISQGKYRLLMKPWMAETDTGSQSSSMDCYTCMSAYSCAFSVLEYIILNTCTCMEHLIVLIRAYACSTSMAFTSAPGICACVVFGGGV